MIAPIRHPIPLGAVIPLHEIDAHRRLGALLEPTGFTITDLFEVHGPRGLVLRERPDMHGQPSVVIRHNRRPVALLYEWATKGEPSGEVLARYLDQAAGRRRKGVIVHRDGRDESFESLRKAARALKVSAPAAHAALLSQQPIRDAFLRYADGFTYRARGRVANPSKDGRVSRVAQFHDGQEPIRIHESINAAADAVGRSRKSIWSAIHNGGVCAGTKWRYLD
jgi:hypothetical protein